MKTIKRLFFAVCLVFCFTACEDTKVYPQPTGVSRSEPKPCTDVICDGEDCPEECESTDNQENEVNKDITHGN